MAGTLFMSPVDVVGKVVRQSGVSALGQTAMFEESDCVVDRYQLSWLCVALVQRAFQFAGLAFSRISKAVLAECATAGAVGCWIVEGAVGAFAVAHFFSLLGVGFDPCLCGQFQHTT